MTTPLDNAIQLARAGHAGKAGQLVADELVRLRADYAKLHAERNVCWCGGEPACSSGRCPAHCATCLCNKPELRKRLDAWPLVEELLAAVLHEEGMDRDEVNLLADRLRDAVQP